MEVKAHLGLGDIRLGSSRAEIVALLGEPDHKEKFSFLDDETTEYFEYEELALELGFSTDDGDRLGVIRSSLPDILLDGKSVVAKPLQTFLSDHPSFEQEELAEDEDDFADGGPDYEDAARDLAVTVNRDTIISLSIFPAWNEDDTPRWPEE